MAYGICSPCIVAVYNKHILSHYSPNTATKIDRTLLFLKAPLFLHQTVHSGTMLSEQSFSVYSGCEYNIFPPASLGPDRR